MIKLKYFMKKGFYTLLFLVLSFNLYAAVGTEQLLKKKSIEFIENKGQIADQFGKVNWNVKFIAQVDFGNIYINQNSVSFAFIKTNHVKRNISDSANANQQHDVTDNKHSHLPDKFRDLENDSIWYDIYRVDMIFKGANLNPKVITKEMTDDYDNYYLAQCPDGVTNVRKYRTVVLQELYPNIDFVVYTNNENKFQYDFVIKPGANPDLINFSFEGADYIGIDSKGNLIVKTGYGNIEQKSPQSYQPNNLSNYTNSSKKNLELISAVSSQFKINTDNSVSFLLSGYNNSLPLIIDPPTRLWGTYYGGSNDDFGENFTCDASGNVYIAGWTFSSNAISTTGAHQVNYGGSNGDAFLVKFNSSGVMQWGTYYGGSGYDQGSAVACDASGNVLLVGSTNSSTAISTSGSHQVNFTGVYSLYDAFLVKFNSSGVRLWGTYYGGSDFDVANAVTCDASGNIYLAGTSCSSMSIATSGSHQVNYAGGSYDAFLVKFSSSGVRQWGTYYGGSDYDGGNAVTCDASGNIYLVGTSSSSISISTTGAHQVNYGTGYKDAFLVKFNSSGVRLWGTYYGGSDEDDGNSITCDASGNIYLAGYSQSSNAISTSGAHQENFGGISDAFLVKFNNSGVRQWGTYFGGSSPDNGKSITCDASGNIYLTGYTNSTAAISTSGAHQENFGGGTYDAFLVKFNNSGVRQWGTYYGGSNEDIAEGACVASGNIYLAGYSKSSNAISTTGAYQENFGGISDAFLVKFDESVPQAITAASITGTSFCQKGAISVQFNITGTYNSGNIFTAQLSDANGNFSSPIQLGILNSTSAGTINTTIPANTPAGSGYRIRVISSNPAITGDDNGANITINSSPTAVITGADLACKNNSQTLSANNDAGIKYKWTITGGTANGCDTCQTLQIIWGAGATGNVKLVETNSSGCQDSSTKTITLNDLPFVEINGTDTACSTCTSTYIATAATNNSYFWEPTNGTLLSTANSQTVSIKWNNEGTGIVKLTQSTLVGCRDSVIKSVVISPKPKIEITGIDNACVNNKYTYLGSSDIGAVFAWSIYDGTITNGAGTDKIDLVWNKSGAKEIKLLKSIPSRGFKDSVTLTVYVNPLPKPSFVGVDSTYDGEIKDYSSTITSVKFKWSVENGSIIGEANQKDVKVQFDKVGISKLKLIVTDNNTGCSDSLIKQIKIKSAPGIVISGKRNFICENDTEIYSFTGNSGEKYLWISDYGSIIGKNDSTSVEIKWTKSGLNLLSLIRNIQSTMKKDTTNINININPVPAKPTISRQGAKLVSSQNSGNQWFLEGLLLKDSVSQEIIPSQRGNYTVQVNISGCPSQISEVYYLSSLAVNDNVNQNLQFSIYPNPANEKINLCIEIDNSTKFALEIYNCLGERLFVKSENNYSGYESIELDVSKYESGIYFLKITEKSSDNPKILKLIKY
ncbi:MAG: SBBP repeat-containing protein [Candidatus Kapabacteria bacterium]|nr:SBBP repeat-containing protein [Candidatus Kapabacteria bacterium]